MLRKLEKHKGWLQVEAPKNQKMVATIRVQRTIHNSTDATHIENRTLYERKVNCTVDFIRK